MVEYYKDLDKKKSNLIKDDLSDPNTQEFTAKSSNDGWNVEVERSFVIKDKGNSSVASIKIDTKFKDLRNVKVESSLSEKNNAQVKLNQTVPLENKHVLELEAKGDCKWEETKTSMYIQAKYAPCRWIKSLIKVTNNQNYKSLDQSQSILANIVFGHPKMNGLSQGLNGEYDVKAKKFKGVEISQKQDLDKSQILATQKIETDKEIKLGETVYSQFHKLGNGNEQGLSAAVKGNKTDVKSVLNHKVTLEPELQGKKQDLSHNLKTVLDNRGVLQVLIAKKLTENLKMLLTGHANLYNINNTTTKDFGIKICYE